MMKTSHLFVAFSSFLWLASVQAKIGFFWHITDFHFDPMYTSHGDARKECRKTEERLSKYHRSSFRDFMCDSHYALIQSACLHMMSRHTGNVEFVLWTGDIVSSNVRNDEDRLEAVRNMTELLSRTFISQFVFPALGHLDPAPSVTFERLWNQWLPTDALATSKHGGYYTFEQSHSKLRIVALNTNLMTTREQNNTHASRQWDWLDEVFHKAQSRKEMVYIMGHAPPGSDERKGETDHSFSLDSNLRYIRLVRKFHKIIAGQFFGHLHSDTFRIFYDQADKPISWAFLAPSLATHRQTAGSNKAGLRLYKYDTHSGKILDFTQYFLDLSEGNKDEVNWAVEYNLTQYYGLNEVTAQTLHNLAKKFRINHDSQLFSKYIRANSVRMRDVTGETCDSTCVNDHICAITRVDYQEYKRCIESAVSALASSTTTTPSVQSYIFHLLICLIVFLNV